MIVADQILGKITTLREIVSKSQSGEGTITAAEMKEKTDELQMASLNLFDKMHKARSEQSNPEPPSPKTPGETTEPKDSEKKPCKTPPNTWATQQNSLSFFNREA